MVTLNIDRAHGPAPAIALFGELRFQSSTGSDTPVEDEDGRVVRCAKTPTIETP